MSEEDKKRLDLPENIGVEKCSEVAQFTEKDWLQLALRVLAMFLFLAFAGACYEEWAPVLSPESAQYQDEYPNTVRNGFSLWYGLSKLLWVIGMLCGALGTVTVAITKRRGFTAIAVAAPLIAIAAALQAPQETYPSVEPISTLLLWCASSALWASLVVLAWVSRQSNAS